MSKYTPGPWGMPDSGQGRISKVGANGGWDGLIATADCGDYARSKSEGLANARLIAAAPELLEALEWCADTLAVFVDDGSAAPDSVVGKNLTTALAAIAKATGGEA